MKSLKIIFILLTVLLLTQMGFSQDAGTTGATFLKLGAGARALGMGSAFTGLSDDVSAIYWNPAGLGFIRRWELSFNYQKLFADLEYYAFFYSHQFRAPGTRRASLGIGVTHLGALENWDSTNGQMPEVSSGDISDLAVIVPLAYRLDMLTPKLSVGMNYKFIKNKLGSYSSNAHGIDFGVLFKTQLSNRFIWSIGANIQNITLKKVKFVNQYESLPYRMRFGSAIKFFITDNQDLIVAYDLAKPKDNNLKHNMGIEYWLHLGAHRLGFRGGYRMIEEDLGKFSFSIGYGLDISSSTGSFYSQTDYAMNNYDSNILGNVNMGSFTLKPNSPEPFKRLSPKMDYQYMSKVNYHLSWEKTDDYDDHDRVNYFVAVDTNYIKINKVLGNAKQIIKNLTKGSSNFDVLFHRITSQTNASFIFSEDSDIQDFYWLVIAYDRNMNMTVATGSDKIGKFSNKNLPDIRPVSIDFYPTDRFNTTKKQGELEAQIVGKIKKPCKIVVFDSTDNKIIFSEIVTQLAPSDTFKFSGEWQAENLGIHNINIICDFENEIEERDETNNIFTEQFATIPYGEIAVKDSIKLEELSYEHIELPTLPYVFFEPNSVEFSINSKTNNETEPDSLLELLGGRLKRDYPGLKIVLKGFADPNSEKIMLDNGKLSNLRAEKVKQKLIEFGARESQIIINTNHRDSAPRLERKSRQIDPEELAMLNEENRRVEIHLPDNLPTTKRLEYDKSFFAPRLIIRKKSEILSEKIRFNCHLNSPTPLKELTILIRDYKDDPFPIKVFKLDTLSQEQDIQFNIDWEGIKDNNLMIAFNKSYFYWVSVTDCNGRKYEAQMQNFFISREVIVKEKRIFALAKFNKVAPLHQFYLEQLDEIEDMMKKDRRIRVRFYGHTDIIGTEERNNELSTDRAMELANWLAKIIDFDYSLTDNQKQQLKNRIDNPLVTNEETKQQKTLFGKGEHYPLTAKNITYGDNYSPQGRTLNRRVDIEIYRMSEFEKPPLAIEKNITFHPWYLDVTFPKYAELPNSQQVWSTLSNDKPILLVSAASNNFYFDQENLQDTLKVIQKNITDSLKQKVQKSNKSKKLKEKKQSGEPTNFEIDVSLINRVSCIELQDSILWLGTDNGIIKWDLTHDTFQVIEINFAKYRTITALKFDPKRNLLYVGTLKGLRVFDGKEWLPDFNVGNGLSGNSVNSISITQDGEILLGTNEGINIMDKKSWKVLANMDSGLPDDNINYIYQQDNNTFWICTNIGVSFSEKENQWEDFSGNSELPSDTVSCMVIDNNGNKWIGTAKGLCLFDNTNKIRGIDTFDVTDKIRSADILCLVKDNSGNIWCTTKYGLSVLQNDTWYSYNYEDGLPSNYTSTIFVGPENKKYVGANGGGVSVLK